MQNEVPIDNEAFDFWTFLSGNGWWLLLALALIVVFLYQKFRKN